MKGSQSDVRFLLLLLAVSLAGVLLTESKKRCSLAQSLGEV